jgi:transaldolase
MKMYSVGDGHVELLAASVRGMEHMTKSLELESDIVTVPLKVLKEWKESSFASSGASAASTLIPIAYKEVSLDRPWQEYDIHHDLTDKGIEKFSADWNSLLA